jgi:transposase
VITIGIDPHKASHTAVALDAGGRVQGELRCLANQATLERLLRWAERWPERIWAVEGAAGLGHLLAQQLVAREETVLDVPATLAARARLLAPGHGRKTDGIDTASVARVAQSQPDLHRVGAEDHSAVLRLLSDRRDELTGERRRAVNRLHRLLRDLRPGGAPTELSATRASELVGHIRPEAAVDLERKVMARALVADLRRIDRALVENRARCAAAVAASDTTVTDIFGISDVLAAKILGHVGDVGRFSSADCFASYSGTAPIEVSSGEVTRHRLSRTGNRSLNNALHLAARVQTKALRSLKRQLAKVVYRHLVADQVRRLNLAS